MDYVISILIPNEWTVQALLTFGVISLARMLFIFGFSFLLYNKSVGTVFELPAKVVIIPLFVIGYIYDIFLNYTVATVMFWQIPQHKRETISGRMRRYLREDVGWRAKIASVLCKILNIFDKDHCGSNRREKTASLRRYLGLS